MRAVWVTLIGQRAGLHATLAGVALACVMLASPAAAAASTLRVNTTKDGLGGHDRRCSLREAIEAVDAPGTRTDCGAAGRSSNMIVLGAGRYSLSIPAVAPDGISSGDLNITSDRPLTITGAGAGATVIDASGLGDRVLSVTSGAKVTLTRLTITGGHAPDGPAATTCGPGAAGANGGGILNGGTLVLEMVAVTHNRAGAGGAGGSAGTSACGGGAGGSGGSGGGISNGGALSLIDSTVSGNVAGAGGAGSSAAAGTGGGGGEGGSGGGIDSASGILRVTNSTLLRNFAGTGGAGGGITGAGGDGGSGGAIAVSDGPSALRNATVAENGIGDGGAPGSPAARPGAGGVGGALSVQSTRAADDLMLRNTIVASSLGAGCAASSPSAITNGGHDLSYSDDSCPGRSGDPKLGPPKDNGGATETLALEPGSAAIDQIPRRGGDCPRTDQRGVRRPQGHACDIGAYEFAIPTITVITPASGAFYERGSRILARFRCNEGGVASAIATCKATTTRGDAIATGRLGRVRFTVTAVDKSGNRAARTIGFDVFDYANPLRDVSGLTPRRIDLGVDYAGSGPLLAIGRGRVTLASDTDSGPPSCWAISCWPGGGIVVYQLLDGPFAGRYVYVAEHISVTVRAGQTVSAGQQIATLYTGYPWSEWGWAAGPGPEALAMTDGHRCPCSDPGGWSTIDGRDMNQLLVALGAPSGYLQGNTPNQSMPRGWPSW